MADRAKSRVAGFTLIELMVTLAVLAVILAAAVPSFTDFIDKYRLRGAVDDVVSVVSNARAEAVKNDLDVNIAFGGTSTTDWCVGANAAAAPTGGNAAGAAPVCDCMTAGECLVSGVRLAVEAGKHRNVAASSNSATFIFDSKLGTVLTAGAITDPAAVTFTSPSGNYDISLDVNALGQTTVCVPAGKPVVAGVKPC